MKLFKFYAAALSFTTLTACNNVSKNGEATTAEGTTVESRVNSDMENQRTEADVDTVTSPGSNYENIKKGNYGVSDEQKQISQDNKE